MTRTLPTSALPARRRPTDRGRSGLRLAVAALAEAIATARAEPPPAARVEPGRRVARVQALPGTTRWTAEHGERELRFRLTDAGGAQVAVAAADLQLGAAPGVTVAPLRAGPAGEYSTQLRWPVAVSDLALTVRLADGGSPPSELALALAPTDIEPPPGPPPPGPPPPAPPPPAPLPPAPPAGRPLAPLAPAARRVVFELGLAGTALLNQGVYGFGGAAEVGVRFRLPFGALGASLRLALEQHIQPEPAPFLINLGIALTYTLARPRWRVAPYVGLWTQALLQRTPDALGAIPLQRNEGGLVLGGLGGAQVRLWRGGLFTELGYRGTVYRQTLAVVPAWSTVFLLLGYRLTTD